MRCLLLKSKITTNQRASLRHWEFSVHSGCLHGTPDLGIFGDLLTYGVAIPMGFTCMYWASEMQSYNSKIWKLRMIKLLVDWLLSGVASTFNLSVHHFHLRLEINEWLHFFRQFVASLYWSAWIGLRLLTESDSWLHRFHFVIRHCVCRWGPGDDCWKLRALYEIHSFTPSFEKAPC